MRLQLLLLLIALAPAARAEPVVSTVVADIGASGGVAVGPEDRVYVADFGPSLRGAGGENVYRIGPQGRVEVFVSGFAGASGNVFGPDGSLYQSDVSRGEVYRIQTDGRRTLIASGMMSPVGLAVARDGTLYVAQCGRNSVSRIGSGGEVEPIAVGAPLNCPNGLTLAPDGNLYTVNFRDGAMVRIALPSGSMAIFANIPGGGSGHLAAANGRFYVAGFRGHRIFLVSASGEVCPIAGTGQPGNDDGVSNRASFFRPNGMAVTRDGNTLYTNTVTDIVPPQTPSLHRNALRRIDGLLALQECAD